MFIETALCAGGTAAIKEKEASVSSDRILLKDVADVSGVSGAEKEALENLYIKRSAVPGYRALLTKDYIANKVEKAFPGTQIKGPEKISVFTHSTGVKAADVRLKAEELIRGKMPWKEEDVKISVKGQAADKNVPDGEVVLNARETDRQKYRGNVIVPVDIEVDGRYYRTEPVSVLVEVNSECYYSETDIKKGAQINITDVKAVRQELTFLPDDIITDASFLTNKSAKRPIGKGTLLTESMFEKMALFKRGDAVKIAVIIGNATVETSGIAKEAGREGDEVEVTAGTGKTLKGVVGAGGNVIIQSK